MAEATVNERPLVHDQTKEVIVATFASDGDTVTSEKFSTVHAVSVQPEQNSGLTLDTGYTISGGAGTLHNTNISSTKFTVILYGDK